SSASTAASCPATPSPKRIFTGRWFRKGAIIALLSDRLDGISDRHVAGLDDVRVDAEADLAVVLPPVRREDAVAFALSGFLVISEQRWSRSATRRTAVPARTSRPIQESSSCGSVPSISSELRNRRGSSGWASSACDDSCATDPSESI